MNHEPINARHEPPDPHPFKAAGSKGPVQRAVFRLLIVIWLCLLTWAAVISYDPNKAAEDMFCRDAARALNQPIQEHC